MKENIRRSDLTALLINSGLAIIALLILTASLANLGLITYTVPSLIGGSLLFIAIAFFNLFLRIAEASRLGYHYYYEHSFTYALLSFILDARFYGFFPLLYLGGSKLAVNKIGRVGFPDIGTNHEDLAHVAATPLFINLAICLAMIPVVIQSSSWLAQTLGFLLASYTVFSTVPWPRSNGLHILSFDTQRWLFLTCSATTLTVFYAVI